MQLASCMPDIAAHANDCRFITAPICMSRAAVVLDDLKMPPSAGGISATRYKIYSDLFAELEPAALLKECLQRRQRETITLPAARLLLPQKPARVSKASSSIQTTTDRHTKPTTLRKCPTSGLRQAWNRRRPTRHPSPDLAAPRWVLSAPSGLSTQTHVDGSRRGRQHHPIVVVGENAGMKAPAFDGFLKLPTTAKLSAVRRAGNQSINHQAWPRRQRSRPAVQQAGGGDASSGRQTQPCDRAPLHRWAPGPTPPEWRTRPARQRHGGARRDDRVFNDMAHDFAGGSMPDSPAASAPGAPGRVFLTVFQCIADAREMVAELAKAQRNVKHRHTPEHRKRPAQPPHQSPMDGQSHQRGHQTKLQATQPWWVLRRNCGSQTKPTHASQHGMGLVGQRACH